MQKLASVFLVFTLIFTTVTYSSGAEAAVGYHLNKKNLKVAGGIGAGGGALWATVGYIAAATSTATGWEGLGAAIAGAVHVTLGLGVAVIGLVVLDEGRTDFSFGPVEGNTALARIYNSELDQLNAIKDQMIEDLEANPSQDMAQSWREYSRELSPETILLAQEIAHAL